MAIWLIVIAGIILAAVFIATWVGDKSRNDEVAEEPERLDTESGQQG